MNLSLGQVMKAVAYCAAAFATVAPIFRHWQSGSINNGQPVGLIHVALFAGFAVPAAWALLSFFLIRGPWKYAAIHALLLASLAVAEGYAFYLLVWGSILVLQPFDPWDAFEALAGIVLINLFLAATIRTVLLELWRSLPATGTRRPDSAGLPEPAWPTRRARTR